MHLSADQLTLHMLSVRVAAAHAQAAIWHLENLRCSQNQKLELIQGVNAVGALKPPPKEVQ